MKFPSLARELSWQSGCRLIGQVTTGKDCSIWYQCTLRGDVHFIHLGDGVNVQDNSVIHVTDDNYPTIIGNEVTIGHGAIIHGCRIGNGCLIGMGAIILDGAELADDCLVAAGSIVSPGKSFPSGSMLMGSPARIKRSLSKEELQGLKKSAAHYINLKDRYLAPELKSKSTT